MLRGDVKVARSRHYSSNDTHYSPDQFQDLIQNVSALVGHANEIKTTFQDKQAKRQNISLCPLTAADLKNQAMQTGDAKGAFKRTLGHLCVFTLGTLKRTKGKQPQLHSSLGCLVFHDDPRNEEGTWNCGIAFADTLRDIQINNVTVLNANDQFIEFFPAKPRNLAAKPRVYHAPGTESKTAADEPELAECLSHPSIALVFPDLQMIFARNNMMREIAPLHFPHLSVLDLSNNELEALPHFDLPNLIHLDVSQNKLSGRLDVALGLVADPLAHSPGDVWPEVLYKSLQYLDLSGNQFSWIVDMQMHAASVVGQYMPAVKNLQLHDNPFVEATMGSFASIVEFRARFNSEMPELVYISPPVFSRRRRQKIRSDNAERYLLDQDKSRGAILAPRPQYEIWPSMRNPPDSANPSKKRRSLTSRTSAVADTLAEENHFCGLMACTLLGKEVDAARRTFELYSQSARRASQRAVASELVYQHRLPSKMSKRTMGQQIAVSEMRRPFARPMQGFPSFGFDGFLLMTNAINRINLKRAWTKLHRVAPRQAAPYSKSGREQGKPWWYDSFRTQILNAKRVQYLLKHRIDGDGDRVAAGGILEKRNHMLYRNAFMKMKCVRNMYRKKMCCDELVLRMRRVVREEKQAEEGQVEAEVPGAERDGGSGLESKSATMNAGVPVAVRVPELHQRNALLAAKDVAVEKKLNFVRDLKALFLKDIATYRRKAMEQHAENEHKISEYSTNIAQFATELVPVLAQQQEILDLRQKVHAKRLESMKLENMYAHFRKGQGLGMF